jgi:malate synthase
MACTSRSASTAPTRDRQGQDLAGIADVVIESALTTIMDCEDSVAAVDAEDKVTVYRNWLGLMKGDLSEEVSKGGKTFHAQAQPDRVYKAPDGGTFDVLAGRSLMLVRNVGHLMTSPAILDRDGNEVPEGIMDAMITALIALHDIGPNGRRKNSRAGSMYVVKPKMHGPEEVAFAVEIFRPRRGFSAWRRIPSRWASWTRNAARRQPQGMHPRREGPHRLHQHRLPRPHRRRDPHLDGSRPDDPQGRHEAGRVDFGLRELECRRGPGLRLPGHAQIGKGMWAMPDLMAAMLEQKIAHPKPAPTPPGFPRRPRRRCMPRIITA